MHRTGRSTEVSFGGLVSVFEAAVNPGPALGAAPVVSEATGRVLASWGGSDFLPFHFPLPTPGLPMNENLLMSLRSKSLACSESYKWAWLLGGWGRYNLPRAYHNHYITAYTANKKGFGRCSYGLLRFPQQPPSIMRNSSYPAMLCQPPLQVKPN